MPLEAAHGGDISQTIESLGLEEPNPSVDLIDLENESILRIDSNDLPPSQEPLGLLGINEPEDARLLIIDTLQDSEITEEKKTENKKLTTKTEEEEETNSDKSSTALDVFRELIESNNPFDSSSGQTKSAVPVIPLTDGETSEYPISPQTVAEEVLSKRKKKQFSSHLYNDSQLGNENSKKPRQRPASSTLYDDPSETWFFEDYQNSSRKQNSASSSSQKDALYAPYSSFNFTSSPSISTSQSNSIGSQGSFGGGGNDSSFGGGGNDSNFGGGGIGSNGSDSSSDALPDGILDATGASFNDNQDPPIPEPSVSLFSLLSALLLSLYRHR